MEMPSAGYFAFCITSFGSLIGCFVGFTQLQMALPMFSLGIFIGATSLIPGLLTILGSLAGWGLIVCFLVSVKAQIETRNALIAFINSR